MQNNRTKFVPITILIISLILTYPASLLAESNAEKAKVAKSKISAIRDDLSDVTDKYSNNYIKLENIRDDISENKIKLAKATKDLEKYKVVLNKRAGTLYRYDTATILDVVLSSKSWNEFLISWDFINKVGAKDGLIVKRVKTLRTQIAEAQRKLAIAEKTQNKVVGELEGQKGELEAGLAKQKSLMAGLESELEKLNNTPKAVSAPGYSSGPVSASGWVFPVANPYSFSNTWGAPRSGHTHQGTDIMTSHGNPCYAVVSGTVSNTSGSSSGLWQTLYGNDGNVYYYMHQSGFAASGRVSQGQVIGYAGNSGNASGGASHVHFEFHPGGGGAVNPYPYLVSCQ